MKAFFRDSIYAKKSKALIICIFVLILLGFLIVSINKNFFTLWNSNSINITATEPLSSNMVKVEFGVSVNTINRSNDLSLFRNREKYTVLYKDGSESQMINDYGENDFLITYDNKYYFSFRQFKFNHRHQHKYNFHFYKKDEKVFIKANIEGKDGFEFNKPMLEIQIADKYRCNVSVDSAGVFFNMIELVHPNKN